MSHKVRVDLKFASLDEYQVMKNQLDQAGLKFDAFVTYALNLVWNQMLDEYKKQLEAEKEDAELAAEVQKELDSEAINNESERDSGPLLNSEGLGT